MEQEIRPRRFIRTAYHCGSLYGPDKKKTGTRIARNDKGKTYYVPADMTYEDWKAVYVGKSKTLEEWLEVKKML